MHRSTIPANVTNSYQYPKYKGPGGAAVSDDGYYYTPNGVILSSVAKGNNCSLAGPPCRCRCPPSRFASPRRRRSLATDCRLVLNRCGRGAALSDELRRQGRLVLLGALRRLPGPEPCCALHMERQA